MMRNLNAKQIALFIGLVMVLSGFIGLLTSGQKQHAVTPAQVTDEQSLLEVKKGNNIPASTIDILQGSGGIQAQGSQPQGVNAGASLQPNAGADNLPRNY